jgi:hypothetical protein
MLLQDFSNSGFLEFLQVFIELLYWTPADSNNKGWNKYIRVGNENTAQPPPKGVSPLGALITTRVDPDAWHCLHRDAASKSWYDDDGNLIESSGENGLEFVKCAYFWLENARCLATADDDELCKCGLHRDDHPFSQLVRRCCRCEQIIVGECTGLPLLAGTQDLVTNPNSAAVTEFVCDGCSLVGDNAAQNVVFSPRAPASTQAAKDEDNTKAKHPSDKCGCGNPSTGHPFARSFRHCCKCKVF